MQNENEKAEKAAAAERLNWSVRKHAGMTGPTPLSKATGISLDTVKGHLSGRNGFGRDDARRYAKACKVSFQWLHLGIGRYDDDDASEPAEAVVEAPLFTTVPAGGLMDNFMDEALGTAKAALPPGDWVAFRVEGESMDRISPPGSIIFVDRADKRLVNGGFYVIDDGTGQSTYKRFVARPRMRFEPVSKNKALEPFEPDNEPTIIGRVKLTTLDLT